MLRVVLWICCRRGNRINNSTFGICNTTKNKGRSVDVFINKGGTTYDAYIVRFIGRKYNINVVFNRVLVIEDLKLSISYDKVMPCGLDDDNRWVWRRIRVKDD